MAPPGPQLPTELISDIIKLSLPRESVANFPERSTMNPPSLRTRHARLPRHRSGRAFLRPRHPALGGIIPIRQSYGGAALENAIR